MATTMVVAVSSDSKLLIATSSTLQGIELRLQGPYDLGFATNAGTKIVMQSPVQFQSSVSFNASVGVTFNGTVTFNNLVYHAGKVTFNNNVTFNTAVAIKGTLSCGTIGGTVADYAEYLEQLTVSERLLPADIVGVYGGKITRKTDGANRAMAISTSPFILGNARIKDAGIQSVPVAFLGQVPVRIIGKVALGDLIVPSGKNDGTGIAIAPDEVSSDQLSLIVGQAWEASDVEAEKQINVGILPADQSASILRIMESKNEVLRRKNGELKAELDELREAVDEIKKRLK